MVGSRPVRPFTTRESRLDPRLTLSLAHPPRIRDNIGKRPSVVTPLRCKRRAKQKGEPGLWHKNSSLHAENNFAGHHLPLKPHQECSSVTYSTHARTHDRCPTMLQASSYKLMLGSGVARIDGSNGCLNNASRHNARHREKHKDESASGCE